MHGFPSSKTKAAEDKHVFRTALILSTVIHLASFPFWPHLSAPHLQNKMKRNTISYLSSERPVPQPKTSGHPIMRVKPIETHPAQKSLKKRVWKNLSPPRSHPSFQKRTPPLNTMLNERKKPAVQREGQCPRTIPKHQLHPAVSQKRKSDFFISKTETKNRSNSDKVPPHSKRARRFDASFEGIPPPPITSSLSITSTPGNPGSNKERSLLNQTTRDIRNDSGMNDYWKLVRKKIEDKKYYPEILKRKHLAGTVLVRFKIFSNGTVEKIRTVAKDRNILFASAARNTVLRAAPFPPPPDGTSHLVEIQIRYNLRDKR